MRLFRCLALLAAGAFLLFSDINAHSLSRNPLNYLSLIDKARIQTPSHRVHSFSEFDLTFDLHQSTQRIRLSLEPNHDILAEDAWVEYIDKDGNVRHAEKINRNDHKIFQGKSWTLKDDGTWTHVGWARINIRRDGENPLFEGAFSINGNNHHIQFRSNYMQTKHEMDPILDDLDDEYMTVFRDSDVGRQPRTELKKRGMDRSCQADKLSFNSNPEHPLFQSPVLKREEGFWGSMALTSLLGKRQIDTSGIPGGGNSGGVNLKSTIGSTSGCPTTRKVALIGVATDCGYTASFNSTDAVRQNVMTQVNSASDVYQSTFNITLGLRNLTVSDAQCPGTAPAPAPWNVPCSGNQTITDRLNLFSAWRGQRGDNNAYWTLLSTCNTGAEVGLAWLGQLCNSGTTTGQDTSGASQSVTGANVVVRTSTEWQVIAHESGHTFGAVHDCDSQTCSDGTTVNAQQCCPRSSDTCDAQAQYIMNPYSGETMTQFSPCTLGNICSALGRNSVKSDCLSDNKGVATVSGNQCGNGIVEDGEDCDCGGAQACGSNSCCDASTCKFKSGAVCDPSNEGCCTGSCQFATSGTVCRATTGVCDPQETCSGTNGTCPPDTTAPDGTDCGNSSQCASGQCTSRDLQCKTLMGSYTQNNDTYACSSQGCSLSCASPEFGPGVCYSMQQNFLDGTPCGGGGKCSNGVCNGSTVGGEVKSWIDDNKTLVIAICSAIGGLILLGLLGCLLRRCRRPRKTRKTRRAVPQQNGVWNGYGDQQGWSGPMPPQMQQRGSWDTGNQNWQPQPPPHTYSGGQSSVRYA